MSASHLEKFCPARCPNCDYDLTGLPKPRCPECGFASGPSDIVIRGWYRKQNRTPRWVQGLQMATGAGGGFAVAIVMVTFVSIPAASMWMVVSFFAPLAIAVVLIGFLLRRHKARPDTIVLIAEGGLKLSMRRQGPRFTGFHQIRWHDVTKLTVRRSGRRLHCLRFRARAGLDRVLGLLTKVYFDCDAPTAVALRQAIDDRRKTAE